MTEETTSRRVGFPVDPIFRIVSQEGSEDGVLRRYMVDKLGLEVLGATTVDDYTITIVDLSSYFHGPEAQGIDPEKLPFDTFSSFFVYDSYLTGRKQDLNRYRASRSAYARYDANKIIDQQLKWSELEPKDPTDENWDREEYYSVTEEETGDQDESNSSSSSEDRSSSGSGDDTDGDEAQEGEDGSEGTSAVGSGSDLAEDDDINEKLVRSVIEQHDWFRVVGTDEFWKDMIKGPFARKSAKKIRDRFQQVLKNLRTTNNRLPADLTAQLDTELSNADINLPDDQFFE